MEPAQLAKTARAALTEALSALQNADDAPDELLEIAEPIAKTMGILHKIERSGGAMLDGRDVALKNVRKVLTDVQALDVDHPAVDTVLEAVAASLAKVNALAKYKGTGQPAPQPAAAAPAPAPIEPLRVAAPPAAAPTEPLRVVEPPAAVPTEPLRVVEPPAAVPTEPLRVVEPPAAAPIEPLRVVEPPAAAPIEPLRVVEPPAAAPIEPLRVVEPPAAAPIEPLRVVEPPKPAPEPVAEIIKPAPVLQIVPEPAPQPVVEAKPAPAPTPAPAKAEPRKDPQPTPAPAKATPAPAKATPAPAKVTPAPGKAALPPGARPVDVELGTHSSSNFYKGLSGNDVIEHGGIFVSTYRIPKLGAEVQLRVLLPGDYEFYAKAIVQWTREASGSSEPGFGARFTQIGNEGRQLVYRYARNREPMFYDDL